MNIRIKTIAIWVLAGCFVSCFYQCGSPGPEHDGIPSAKEESLQKLIDLAEQRDTLRYIPDFQQLLVEEGPEGILQYSDKTTFEEYLSAESLEKLTNTWVEVPDVKQNFTLEEFNMMPKRVAACRALDTSSANALRRPIFMPMDSALLEKTVSVPIVFHIASNGRGEGTFSDMQRRLEKQVEVLNRAFKGHFDFFIKEIDPMRPNDRWLKDACKSVYVQKSISRKSVDPYVNVNVYTADLSACNLLGWSTFPSDTYVGTNEDMIFIDYRTLPSTTIGQYNDGKTLVHEIGHYFGLLHTFHDNKNDSCDAPLWNGCAVGDLVADTPPQRHCHFGDSLTCKSKYTTSPKDTTCNTCTEDNDRPDPVKNFMGYNWDACLQTFTPLQFIRMKKSTQKFRKGFIISG
jgi:hypothetical protein